MSALLGGCCTSRSTSRCSIVATPVGVQAGPTPPQLTIMARNPVDRPVAMSLKNQVPIHCGPEKLPFDSPIDALTAIWVGHEKGDAQQVRTDCPAFPAKLSVEAPQIADPPCGEMACPNQQVTFGTDRTHVHILFYDDPSRHRPGETTRPSGACYYRVYAVSVAWDGTAPQ